MLAQTEPGGPVMDVRAVAALLRVSARTVQRLVSSGRFAPPFRVGRSTRWTREAVETWIEEKVKAAEKGGD